MLYPDFNELKRKTDVLLSLQWVDYFSSLFNFGASVIIDKGSVTLFHNKGQKLHAKMALFLTPQAMYNQFKRSSAGSVREFYYIYRSSI